MDLIEGLPHSRGYSIIFVVVDHLSKYSYFIPLCYPYTSTMVAQPFLDYIVKLHEIPKLTLSDLTNFFSLTFGSLSLNYRELSFI